MTRDMDLVRKLLIFFAEKPGPEHIEVPPVEGYDSSTIKNHLILMHEAGFLRTEQVKSSTSDRIIYVVPFDLTWQGHEFLSKIRDEGIWQRVKTAIGQKGAPLTIDIIANVATKIGTSLIGDV